MVFPFVYLVTPYTGLIQNDYWRYGVFLSVLLVKGFVVIVGFPCMTIMLTNSAPSLKVLGTLNGIATTFSGLGKAAGPAMTGATFSWGVQRGYIIAGWWLLAIIAVIGAIPPWFLVEGDGPSQTTDVDEEELFLDSLIDDDDDDDENDAAIAGDAHDMVGLRLEVIPSEPIGSESKLCPPLLSDEDKGRGYGSTDLPRNTVI